MILLTCPRCHKADDDYQCWPLLKYRYAAGYDCSTPGNKRCWGVWQRQLKL